VTTSRPSCPNSCANRCSSERLLALRVVAFAAVVPILMRFRLDRVARWTAPSGNAALEPTPQEVSTLTAAIDHLLVRWRPLVRTGCVTRGVTLYTFLRRAGADVSLRFGIGLVNGAIAGHCWIVYQGEPLAERRDPRGLFTETWAFTS
jgi:hypothetical protein